ncbi:L,D-transpeptidase family protein [Xinfangfangia sp. D13-10-4-6]|uniref:L,D-transpeptidase family protein n=1 Tax=Pseudogemmobacter hezensis TaxID=2737662 RepID=UPI001554CB4B|nr:L,D-transpeptidase family protein [Pseudogemmobacter hezensis]NPD15406.1 L,D-transpeptidase family protein [Pseudogemmobacter hezensis]
MRAFRFLLILVLALGLAACGKKDTKFRTYKGPEVTSVQIQKGARKMYLLHNERVLKSYDIGLGFTPEGHKQFEGDGKTPEGTYYMTYKNPKSSYHLSLYINYPNVVDREYASSQNRKPGGEIFIHGGPKRPVQVRDWTEGCIAVTDREIEEVYSMVNLGTPVHILP